MEVRQRLSACALLLLCMTLSTNGGNILVWYTEASHWINMKPVLDTLVDRGHQVTVLVPSASLFMKTNETSRFRYEPFDVSFTKEDMEGFVKEFLQFSMYEMHQMNYVQLYIRFIDILTTNLNYTLMYLEGVLKSDTTMRKLKDGKYDLLLADPVYAGSDLTAEILGIPLVFTLRFSMAHTWERYCGQLPTPPSYVPAAMSKLTDRMSFSERLWNVVFYAVQDIVFENIFWKRLDKYYSEIKGDHWINMKPVLDTLVDRGHQVTVLVPSASLFMKTNETSRFRYEPFDVSFTKEDMEGFVKEFLQFSMYEMHQMNYVQLYIRFIDILTTNLNYTLMYLDGVLKSDTMMRKLKDGKYDLLLADPVYAGSDLTAEILGIPLVFTLRFSMAHTWERYCGQLPTPPSYVPAAMSKLTDRMSFSERLWNVVFYAVQDIVFENIFWKRLDKYYSEIKGKPTSACKTMSRADIWLMRTYWDFDFPRPLLPNFKFVGGIHCRPAKPLPDDMEEFVQSSGHNGVVVFTLGSIIKNITIEKANLIASGLAQIPQKVLWRYSGEKPETLGANTKLYDWIPQNDLLGHPKTRAFITHGGANGVYEAIYHGVPMVGIPMFADQPGNIVHMKTKGAAVMVDVNSMKAEDLRDALNAVINDKSYKENAMRLSSIHHDRPMTPLEEAVFWIEFTLRNKGAKHLRVQAHQLTWYQYHSLDVLVFLLTVVLLLIVLLVKTCTFCLRRCCGRTGKKKTE
ncbi:UDP-glucuronosyltransferase 2A2-like [Betta splendens]|uniref:glucuronosyltransferase n=1 Tax=Betta splendens TaxID=158456 RepID=A0A6P7NHH6_BETSP|nr:UDP-glucuronosyltransferase 2A2-like [Betta splendens]